MPKLKFNVDGKWSVDNLHRQIEVKADEVVEDLPYEFCEIVVNAGKGQIILDEIDDGEDDDDEVVEGKSEKIVKKLEGDPSAKDKKKARKAAAKQKLKDKSNAEKK